MKKLSLAKLSKKELSHIKINEQSVMGGLWVWTWPPSSPDVECGCNCLYADQGGSSIEANGKANMKGNLFSPLE